MLHYRSREWRSEQVGLKSRARPAVAAPTASSREFELLHGVPVDDVSVDALPGAVAVRSALL